MSGACVPSRGWWSLCLWQQLPTSLPLTHTPLTPYSIIAATEAATEASDANLLAAAPWFAAGHVPAAMGDAVATCDWCSRDAGAARAGCDRCSCAMYCGIRCAAAAKALHTRNCARLALLARTGNALRSVADLAPPMFEFD